MINSVQNVSFKSSIYTLPSQKTPTVKVSDNWSGNGPLEKMLSRGTSLPHVLSSHQAEVLGIQSVISSTTRFVEGKRKETDQQKEEAYGIYRKFKAGYTPLGISHSCKKVRGIQYETIVEQDKKGFVSRISHFKDGKVDVIYKFLDKVRAEDIQGPVSFQTYAKVNGYYYIDDKSVEYVQRLNDKLACFAADTDVVFPEKQWPCRNFDNSPQEKIIGFHDNGGYLYYKDYNRIGAPEFKESISYKVGKQGDFSVSYHDNQGREYSYSDQSKESGYTRHEFSTGKASRPFIWA